MTTRQISETIEDIYGFEVSEGMVSDITDKLLPRIEEWQTRPLSSVYPIVFIDAVHFSVRDDGVIRKFAVHEMDDDKDFYKAALGITRSIPSEETLRQRMDDIGDSLRQTILEQNVEMLLANKIQPTALANGLVPEDIDVTPMDNNESKAGNFDLVTLAEENKDSLFYDAWRIWFRYFVSMGYAGWNELWEAV